MNSHRTLAMKHVATAAIALFLIIHSPSQTDARILKNSPSTLVDSVCKNALNYSDCVSALESDPQTPSASDLKVLAKIAFAIAVTNTTNGKDYIAKMAKDSSTATSLVPALKQCVSDYESAVVSFDSAKVELDEDIMSANYDAKVAGDSAVSCETSLNSTRLDVPSVRARNYYVNLFSNIGYVITDMLES